MSEEETDDTKLTEEVLSAMTIAQIKDAANKKCYTLEGSRKSELIASFLEAQG